MALMAELKRRRVFRVAAMYGFAAWIITEVSATVFPALFVPDWAITFVVVLLITGFPITIARRELSFTAGDGNGEIRIKTLNGDVTLCKE